MHGGVGEEQAGRRLPTILHALSPCAVVLFKIGKGQKEKKEWFCLPSHLPSLEEKGRSGACESLVCSKAQKQGAFLKSMFLLFPSERK